MSEPRVADPLAEAAVAPIESGMLVGLGTGLTAARAVLALAERVREERLDVRCVPSSHQTETLARSQQLNVIDFGMIERVDYLFDGAGEVDHQLRMLKGQHGALVKQRLVARAASRRVYLLDEHKYVEKLGSRSALAIAVVPFALASIRADLRELGLIGVVRREMSGQMFITENALLIIDVSIDGRDPAELADQLDHIAGVVDHGIFLDEADEVILGSPNGAIRRLERATPRVQ